MRVSSVPEEHVLAVPFFLISVVGVVGLEKTGVWLNLEANLDFLLISEWIQSYYVCEH